MYNIGKMKNHIYLFFFLQVGINMEEMEQEGCLIPMIDGGTEGFKGNVRVMIPGMTACIDCTLDLYPPQVTM